MDRIDTRDAAASDSARPATSTGQDVRPPPLSIDPEVYLKHFRQLFAESRRRWRRLCLGEAAMQATRELADEGQCAEPLREGEDHG